MFKTASEVYETYERARIAFEKQAYGEAEHAELAGMASRAVGKGAPSPAVAGTIQKGALKVDQGIRHPWLPHTDPLHSFPGSQTKAMVGRNVVQKQDMAVRDISKSIATRGSPLSGARAHRGLMNLGEGHHQMMDISAHTDKPALEGKASRLRGALKGREVGYGGGVVSGREHGHSGLTREGTTLHADLDRLRPDSSAVDRQAIARSERFGATVAKKVEARLVSHHGMHPTEAAEHASHFFQQMHAPSRPSQLVGEASRTARYLGGEVSRAGSAVRGVLSRLR
jgi:hypothetical protein